jgi:rhodanese-related sulfurtransferase
MESSSAHAPAVETTAIPHDELRRRLRDPSLTIVNVLPYESYRAGRIPGSVHLPVGEIPAHALTVLPDRTRELVLYCGTET